MSKNEPKNRDKFVYFFLAAFFLITTLLACLSTGTYESGDSIQHYLISRYSFKHPGLFFSHWGKPFFVLLSSAFAQFGFLGINIFNILCATLTGLIAYKTAKLLQLDKPWLALVFSLFAPIYYVTLITGLTEPLFALMLIAGIYLVLKENFIASALLISFLPFTRTEGFILLPLFALAYLIPLQTNAAQNFREFMKTPHFNIRLISCFLLITGTVMYSITGYLYNHDLFWIATQNPYQGAKDIYGSGTAFHFIAKNEFILGTPLVVLFCIGCLAYLLPKRFIPNPDNDSRIENTIRPTSTERILIPGIFFTYLFLHSLLWWKGMNGSLGLIRVMAGVTPLAGLVALRGLAMLSSGLKKIPIPKKLSGIKPVLLFILTGLIIYMPFKQHRFPSALGYEDIVVKQSVNWLQQNHPELTGPDRKFYYQYPYLSVFLNNDPFDPKHYVPLWSTHPKDVAAGSLLIWDSHYGPNESKLPLNTLQADTTFELLNSFKADPATIPHDKTMFEVYIFRKK